MAHKKKDGFYLTIAIISENDFSDYFIINIFNRGCSLTYSMTCCNGKFMMVTTTSVFFFINFSTQISSNKVTELTTPFVNFFFFNEGVSSQ